MTRVRFAMHRRVTLAPPATTAGDGERLLFEQEGHYLLVADGGQIVGVACACDLGRSMPDTALSSCMRTLSRGIGDGASLDEAARAMSDQGAECLPVFSSDGRLVGILTGEQLRRCGVASDALPANPLCRSCYRARHVETPPREDGAGCRCRVASPASDAVAAFGSGPPR